MPTESGLRAVQQTADIFPVCPNHKGCNQKRQHEYRPVTAAEDQSRDWKAGCARYRAERNISRCKPQKRKQSPTDRCNAPVQQQKERSAAKNALAALKRIKRRKDMPDYAKQGGKVLALQSKSEIRVNTCGYRPYKTGRK